MHFQPEQEQEQVHSLWIGPRLGSLELLTLHSFVSHGHGFKLWVYEPPETRIPELVEVGDAREILPESAVFRYQHTNQFGHGKGSLAGFSDIFRYHLLHQKGGWWVDMDVTCLQPFETNNPYFFRTHHSLPLVGNVLKAPAGSELMAKCADLAMHKVTPENTDWHLPIQILVNAVYELNLEGYIQKEWSNQDKLEEVFPLLKWGGRVRPEWRFIHWMNEAWRQYKIPRAYAHPFSAYHRLLDRYGLGNQHVIEHLRGVWSFAPWTLRIR